MWKFFERKYFAKFKIMQLIWILYNENSRLFGLEVTTKT